MDELVSVIIPGYNCEATIERAICSALDQDYINIEVIFVDDNSSDNTLPLVKSIPDSRLKIYSLRNNSGSPATPRNVGIFHASGKYIAFLDSDDCWLPSKIRTQMSHIMKHSFNVCHSSYSVVNHSGEFVREVKCNPVVDLTKMLFKNEIGNLTGIYNCHVLGKFYQRNIGHEDYEMWIRIISKGGISSGIVNTLAHYYSLPGSVSSNNFKGAFWHFKILFQSKEVSIAKLPFYFLIYVFRSILDRGKALVL